MNKALYAPSIFDLMFICHDIAKSKGWYESERTFGDIIALIHSEASEALEEYRDGKKFSLLEFDGRGKPVGIAVEFADILIRIFDTCQNLGIPLAEALEAKIEYNRTRPHRHGGKTI